MESPKSTVQHQDTTTSSTVEGEQDKSYVPEYKYSPEEFKKILNLFYTRNWPVQLLLRDHYGAKVLVDNDVFGLIEFYKHTWKYDKEDDELLILHKKTKHGSPTFTKWTDLYPYINIKKTGRGEFLFDGAAYTEAGLEFDNTNFQFSHSEFRDMLNKFVKEGWPVQFLLRDHYGAKVLYDNQVFSYIEFYGHTYKWDEDQGLILMIKREGGIEWAAWKDLVDDIPIQRTPQGWLLFDGWVYGRYDIIFMLTLTESEKGLLMFICGNGRRLTNHTSFLKKPSQMYPLTEATLFILKICYVDIMTFNWEHDGWPGFGIGIGNPHGHTSIEFGDDLGNFYSVGMYMDPRSPIDTKKAPAATIRACLMSPDPYLPSKGEKTVHRYFVGKGEQGRENISKLKQYIEHVQDWRKAEDTGIVVSFNVSIDSYLQRVRCTVANITLSEIEKFAQEKLGGKLVKLDDTSVFVGGRKRVTKAKTNWFTEALEVMWNMALLFLMDFLIWMIISNPLLAKKIGSEKQDDFSDFDLRDIKTKGESEKGKFGFTLFAIKNFKSLSKSLRPHSVKFPRKVRLAQLYSPRLRRYSALLRT